MFKARNKDDVLFTRRKNLVQVEHHHHEHQHQRDHVQPPECSSSSTKCEDILELVDVDDVDDADEPTTSASKLTLWSASVDVTMGPIDLETAVQLKTLLFGDATKVIGTQWSRQYFEFEYRSPNLWYGLVQHRGGPCGVLAALQAFLLVHFFHMGTSLDESEVGVGGNLTKHRWHCLAEAISSILWQIGGNRQVAVLAFEEKETFVEASSTFRPDGITEHLVVAEFFSRAELLSFLDSLFERNLLGVGCVSLAYSCLLSRGLDEIRQDYDPHSITSLLCTEALLCTQELVNLMLVGRAVSNVFDRSVRYNDQLVLRGITHQSTIGFLTLHEHRQDFNVGTCYKNPKHPVFVVLSEGHFTVLFRKDAGGGGGGADKRFDLFYYDGLLRQEDEVRLTIETMAEGLEFGGSQRMNKRGGGGGVGAEAGGAVPIECVIRTKWPNARVNWNQSEKIF